MHATALGCEVLGHRTELVIFHFTHIGAALEMLTVGYAGQQHQFVPFPWFCCRWPEVVTLGTVAVLVVPWQCANVLAVQRKPPLCGWL